VKFLASITALVGYMLVFAAVQGGKYADNPLLGVTSW
jgi:hypothetical protein